MNLAAFNPSLRRGGTRQAVAAVLASLALTLCGSGGSITLFDFESGVEGWEHEPGGAITPDPAQIATNASRRGSSSLAFVHHFSKASKLLHCRVIEGFERDVTSIPGFQGFSAWVFIPNGSPFWEAKMFVRSGQDWTWSEGPTRRGLQPGWYRVDIPAAKITVPTLVQDLGVQVINFTDDIESRILIDQVEALCSEVNTTPAERGIEPSKP